MYEVYVTTLEMIQASVQIQEFEHKSFEVTFTAGFHSKMHAYLCAHIYIYIKHCCSCTVGLLSVRHVGGEEAKFFIFFLDFMEYFASL